MNTPDFEAFAKDVMQDWPEGFDLDGVAIQKMALKHGLLRKIEGGFDPDKHECPHGCSERGDAWYVQTFGLSHQERDDE
tara:strand:+ start:2242 stop:2478 length:237 start_codon:yes stop_codon:yes gene_type:complete